MTPDEFAAELFRRLDVPWEEDDGEQLIAKYTGPFTAEHAAAALRCLSTYSDSGLNDQGARRYIGPELEHSLADDILCLTLRRCGHDAVVDEYLKIGRYFA